MSNFFECPERNHHRNPSGLPYLGTPRRLPKARGQVAGSLMIARPYLRTPKKPISAAATPKSTKPSSLTLCSLNSDQLAVIWTRSNVLPPPAPPPPKPKAATVKIRLCSGKCEHDCWGKKKRDRPSKKLKPKSRGRSMMQPEKSRGKLKRPRRLSCLSRNSNMKLLKRPRGLLIRPSWRLANESRSSARIGSKMTSRTRSTKTNLTPPKKRSMHCYWTWIKSTSRLPGVSSMWEQSFWKDPGPIGS